MGPIAIPAVVRTGFSIRVEHGDKVRLKLNGNADMEMVPLLGPFLLELHEDMVQSGEASMIVDLRELYFMNSSCFKSLLTWIAAISKLESGMRYIVQFITNPKLHWQRRNLDAMQAFAPAIVRISTE